MKLFLVTGGAGFIGSHLTARLLADGDCVRVLDNFSTGSPDNLPSAGPPGADLEVVRGDVRDLPAVERAARGAAAIFHQAAMRSVPRSVADPLGANENNVTGTLHVFEAARRAGVRRVVYASSSSVYGDRPELPKQEDQPPAPISPYAVSKLATEEYGRVWHRLYGVETVGLRYFNVFGPRQDPASEYAAVIPKFILWALRGEPLEIHGDGRQSRDFTYIDNVVEANLRASVAPDVGGEVFNVGCGGRPASRRSSRVSKRFSVGLSSGGTHRRGRATSRTRWPTSPGPSGGSVTPRAWASTRGWRGRSNTSVRAPRG